MRRRLTVILASDVAGYSRLVAAAEEETIHRLRQASGIFSNLVEKHHGRVFKTAGDAILAEFQSAVDATRCAMDFQDANNAQNAPIAADKRLLFRIGIAIGDVLVAEDGDLLGDGVNIAARLEGLAEAGGVCISDDVRTHVASKIEIDFVDLGEQSLKNIPRPVRAFKLVADGKGEQRRSGRRRGKAAPLIWIGSAAAIIALALGIFVWQRGFPGTTTAATGEPFDAASIPLVDNSVREQLADYVKEPDWKAIAISQRNVGVQVGAADAEMAKRQALEKCERREQRDKGYCRLYAVGNTVVWPKSMLALPMPADIRTEPVTDAPADPDWIPLSGVPEAYRNGADHRAYAISGSSSWWVSQRSSRPEAIRLAVERCSDQNQMPCLLVSVDGFPTVRSPKSHSIVRIFTLAGEHGMTDADRQRLAPIYGGADWRAMAKGRSGGWYAVNGAESETAAEEKALALCHSGEKDCSLYAINNFRVGEK
jgi:class 3 adenylate cyclase